jgi:RNA polymerase sigma-70 factor (ECF subfamily)
VTTARRRAIDRHRRESTREARHLEAVLIRRGDEPPRGGGTGARRPATNDLHLLPPGAGARDRRWPSRLKLLGGLDTPEIAKAFLQPEATVAQRLVRAKRKIRDAGIPYRVPADADLPDRLQAALATVYLIYTAGPHGQQREGLHRVELCVEAVGWRGWWPS